MQSLPIVLTVPPSKGGDRKDLPLETRKQFSHLHPNALSPFSSPHHCVVPALAFLQNLDPLQHRQHFVDPSEFLPRFAFRLTAVDLCRVYHQPVLIVQHRDTTPL